MLSTAVHAGTKRLAGGTFDGQVYVWNAEGERTKILSLFMGPTVPEAHKLTGYGLWLAGGEYFDHLRAYRSKDSYVRRTLLADNPAKASLAKTVRELVAA